MTLYLRLIRVLFMALLRASTQPRLIFPDGESRLKFRAWPGDCDVNRHMTQARYGSFTDLGRIDWGIRSGMDDVVRAKGLAPIAGAMQIEFRREIKPFERFELVTRFLGWEGSNILAEHIFEVERDGQKVTCARAFVRAGLYDRKEKAFVDGDVIAKMIGHASASPTLGEIERQFLQTRLTRRQK